MFANDRSLRKHWGTRANQYRARMAEILIRCSHCFYWCQKMLRCLICMFVFMLVLLNQFTAWRMFARQRKTYVPLKKDLKQLLASDTSLSVIAFAAVNVSFCPSHWIFVTGSMDLCMLVPGCRTGQCVKATIDTCCVETLCAHTHACAHTHSSLTPWWKGHQGVRAWAQAMTKRVETPQLQTVLSRAPRWRLGAFKLDGLEFESQL